MFSKLQELSKYTGMKEKENILNQLFYECTGLECKYIVRYITGNFKIGCAGAIVQSGLARAFYELYLPLNTKNTLEDWEKSLQKSFNQYPNYEVIIKAMQESKGDPEHLKKICKLTPGIPCKPMLAKPTKGINIIFQRFEGRPFTCEYKYDGLRGQIHYMNGNIVIYSRNLENLTEQYPDIALNIRQAIKPETKNFILDSEIVALDQRSVAF